MMISTVFVAPEGIHAENVADGIDDAVETLLSKAHERVEDFNLESVNIHKIKHQDGGWLYRIGIIAKVVEGSGRETPPWARWSEKN
jgi:hypothetical protein